jgi:predicted transposase YbfD/YdcC
MGEERAGSLAEHFGGLEDPRRGQGQRHRLMDIVVIAICAVVCGAEGWVDVAEFGQSKEAWFRSFLELPNGIPSHDTFGRVFSLISPERFQERFRAWVHSVNVNLAGQVVAVDEKTSRRSHDRRAGTEALHVVSAWATEARLTLGQRAVDDKSNEITAIPKLLELLLLQGCIVTIDALGTQQEIAHQIVATGADYVLAVKENQPKLYREVLWPFSRVEHPDYPALLHDTDRNVEKDHGRLEQRVCQTITAPEHLASLNPDGQWTGLRSVIAVHASRRVGGKRQEETRYFISSLDGNAKTAANAVGQHWGIENRLHWVLDVAFRDDDSRIRTGHAAENLAVLRHIALNLLNAETTLRRGVKGKRLTAGWDNDYLKKVLAAA